MRSRITAILSILGISVVGLAAASIAGFGSSSSNRASGLAARLPESDVVAIFDTRRFFDDALPKLFAAKQPMLADVTGKLDQMQQRTGIDLRKFDQVAVGARMSRVSATEFDLDTVVLASGSYSDEALFAAVKLASNGTYREESIGGRTVYVFAAKNVAAKNAPKGSPSAVASAVERAVNGMAKEIAVATLDQTTVAFGSLERVRQAIEAKTSVAADVAGLLSPQAVVSFAARTPNGTSKLLPLDNDELGRNLDAIRYLAGSMDLAAGNVSAHLMARTSGPTEAKGLHSTLLGMQELGKNILGGSKRAEQQVLARMIGSAKIGRSANDITLDLSVPQRDIDALIAGAR